MTEAHDENSINTDITFESGDENVSASKKRFAWFKILHDCILIYISMLGRCN